MENCGDGSGDDIHALDGIVAPTHSQTLLRVLRGHTHHPRDVRSFLVPLTSFILSNVHPMHRGFLILAQYHVYMPG